MANKPNNPSLWSKAKSMAKQKFDVYPSAYANGWAAKWYKSKGGTWRKAEYGMEVMEDGGIPDNEGFRALPPNVQQQIIDNMAFGGYIPEMMYGGKQYMQQGGQQDQIMQLIQAYAQMNQMDPNELMEQLQEMPADKQQQAIQQMAQTLQQASQQPNMAQAAMAFGGYIPEVMAYGGSAQQAAIAIAMKKAGKKPKSMQKGGEPDGAMALGQISAAMDKLEKLRQFIQPDSDLEPWVSSKLTLMDHYTDAVSDYMMYNPEAQGEMMEEPKGLPMPEMKNGGGVPERYKNMGFTKVGVKKESTRPGKKWMVLAKKGDQYKVVHGGYDGMKDFSQHGSEKRKENFWNRMGGKNSSKATDPFSPLYWHKKFGTWEDGGEIPEMKGGGSTFSGNAWYKMGGMPCYECGGMFAEGGMYNCPDQEKDPVTGKCAADVARGKEAAAANKAAAQDMNAWAKQVAAIDRANAKQDAAQYAGQMSFDYDWMGSPVDKAEKKAAMAQYKQFFQQNPNTFVADDTSGFSPEQKYIIASKLKQKASTPMGSKAFQQKFKQDPNFFDLKRLQSDIVTMMGGWDATRNYLFGNKKYGGPAVGEEMDVTPEQLEMLKAQGYKFEII